MRAKQCTKERDACAKLLFCSYKPIAFVPLSLPLPSSLLKLPVVIIQKLCYITLLLSIVNVATAN